MTTSETPTTRWTHPAPTSVSEQARQALARAVPTVEYPALDDVEGWLALVEQNDAAIRERFLSVELPATSERTEIGGVPIYVSRAPGVPDTATGPLYLNVHGGALLFGGGELTRMMGEITAMGDGMTTWSVDYRMPPLHPFPAGLDDTLAVYRAALEARDPADIVVGGGSAGGNLAAALLLRAREEGLPMPAALVLQSPEVDLTESGDSFQVNRDADPVLSSLMPINRLYAAGRDLADPLLSPLFADLTGFPPTFLQTGTRDLFLSNTVRMHRALRAAGVPAELHVFEAMPHGGFGGAPEDTDVTTELRTFLRTHQRAPLE